MDTSRFTLTVTPPRSGKNAKSPQSSAALVAQLKVGGLPMQQVISLQAEAIRTLEVRIEAIEKLLATTTTALSDILPTYADNASAIAASLTLNQLYKDSSGVIHIVTT